MSYCRYSKFVFSHLICEQESGPFSLDPARPVQNLQVFKEVAHIVGTSHGDLEISMISFIDIFCIARIGYQNIANISNYDFECLLDSHLERLVSSDKGGQFCETLLSRSADADQHQVPARVANHSEGLRISFSSPCDKYKTFKPRDFDEVDDCVREEYEVHV